MYRTMTDGQLHEEHARLTGRLAKGVPAAKYPALVWCLAAGGAELKARSGR